MTRVVVGEQPLVLGFVRVVELLDEAGAQLVDEWRRVEAREHRATSLGTAGRSS